MLALGLLLNLVGIQWGVFNQWHADEVSWPTEAMVREHRVNPHYFMYGNIAFYRTALAVGPAVAYTEAFDPPPPRSSQQAHADWLERYQRRIALWPRVLSAIEGIEGSVGLRFADMTASARRRPSRTRPSTAGSVCTA